MGCGKKFSIDLEPDYDARDVKEVYSEEDERGGKSFLDDKLKNGCPFCGALEVELDKEGGRDGRRFGND